MQAIMVRISGNWAHFKKPETNNNPLTHDFITKTALIGMIGAVCGIERGDMRPLFPQLSKDLKYGVALLSPVKKQSWGFTLRRFNPDRAGLEADQPAPRAFELLCNPTFAVVIVLAENRSAEIYEKFVNYVEAGETHFDPVLGLHNCPAELTLLQRGMAQLKNGSYHTSGFLLRQSFVPDLRIPFRIGFEHIPTFQNDDMWNPPDQYQDIVYPNYREGVDTLLSGTGDYYHLIWQGKEEDWCLI